MHSVEKWYIYRHTVWKLRKFTITLFEKKFVKVTFLVKTKILKSWFDEIFWGNSKFFIFPHCALVTKYFVKSNLRVISLWKRWFHEIFAKYWDSKLKCSHCALWGVDEIENKQTKKRRKKERKLHAILRLTRTLLEIAWIQPHSYDLVMGLVSSDKF